MSTCHFTPIVLLSACLTSPVWGAESGRQQLKRTTYLTAEAGGKDFATQGEYTGILTVDGEPVRIGMQVIALGGGKFRAMAFPGGLPGAGWDGEEKVSIDGEYEGNVALFEGPRTRSQIAGNLITVESLDGEELGTLTKVFRQSDTLHQEPPAGAVVLFDGTSPEAFEGGEMTADGLLKQGTTSHELFDDCKVHIEFQLSFMPYARGQGRSNSGVYLQGRYECQILDSFGLEGMNNECGGIYSVRRPNVNMCFPPLAWQTYDVEFQAARYDANGEIESKARMSVWHNGVLIHEDVELPHPTAAAPLSAGPASGPLYLQNHGNELRFRNIWIVRK